LTEVQKHVPFFTSQNFVSGNYTGWKATCIGNNSGAAVSMLKQVDKLETFHALCTYISTWKS
jgi:hypothetical protein